MAKKLSSDSSLFAVTVAMLGVGLVMVWSASSGLALATAGDTVVLAPACSSFDMFEDYAARGRAFKDEVRRLAETRRG